MEFRSAERNTPAVWLLVRYVGKQHTFCIQVHEIVRAGNYIRTAEPRNRGGERRGVQFETIFVPSATRLKMCAFSSPGPLFILVTWSANHGHLETHANFLPAILLMGRKPAEGGGVLSYIRYVGMCHPEGYGF